MGNFYLGALIVQSLYRIMAHLVETRALFIFGNSHFVYVLRASDFVPHSVRRTHCRALMIDYAFRDIKHAARPCCCRNLLETAAATGRRMDKAHLM